MVKKRKFTLVAAFSLTRLLTGFFVAILLLPFDLFRDLVGFNAENCGWILLCLLEFVPWSTEFFGEKREFFPSDALFFPLSTSESSDFSSEYIRQKSNLFDCLFSSSFVGFMVGNEGNGWIRIIILIFSRSNYFFLILSALRCFSDKRLTMFLFGVVSKFSW